MQEPVPGISAIPDEKNARYFKVIVAGPEGVSVLTDDIGTLMALSTLVHHYTQVPEKTDRLRYSSI